MHVDGKRSSSTCDLMSADRYRYGDASGLNVDGAHPFQPQAMSR